MHRVLLVGLALLVAACTTRPEVLQDAAQLRATPVSHAGFADLTFDRLGFPGALDFRLGPGSPVMELGMLGRSYVHGFMLPDGDEDVKLIVRSYFIGTNPFDQRALVPIVTFLDRDLVPVRTTSPEAVRVNGEQTELDSSWELGRLEIDMILSGQLRARARYAIVHTDASLAGGEVELLPGRVLLAAATVIPIFVPSGPPRPYPKIRAVTGRIKVIAVRPRT